jgi:transketolase
VDGHDLAQLQQAFSLARAETTRPSIIVARTSIIHGISFLNDQRDGHFIKLTPDEAALAAQELEEVAHA